MKKILQTIAVVCVMIPFMVVAQADLSDKENPEDVLSYNAQKGKLLQEVYSNPDYVSLIDIEKATITMEDLSRSFLAIEKEYEQYNEERTIIEEKYWNVQESINKILNESALTQELVVDTLTKISLLKNKISKLKEAIAVIQWDIEKSSGDLQEYTKFLYYLYNDYYWWWSWGNNVSLLVKSDNIAESLSTNDSVIILTKYLQNLLDTMKQKQHENVLMIQDVNKAQLAYTQAWMKLKDDLDSLDQQKASLYELLSYLQTTKEIADSRVSALRSSKEELVNQLWTIKSIARQASQVRKDTPAAKLLAMKDKEDWDTYFSWPVLWSNFVSRFFHDEFFFKETWEKYEWVRFEVPQRSPVYSTAPWVVYKVVYDDDMSLAWIILLHKYGYASFYSPLNEVFVKEWTLVSRGEILWMSWWQPWTKWSWIDSDWPRLDFAITKNGDPFDPLLWLDISIYVEKNELPEIYHTKFIKNLFERDVPLDKLGVIPWETIAERRDGFLALYARWPFADSSLWVDAANQTWIDPIFGICIWFAETSFKNFKTANNIWNVWNDDSWNTVVFSSPLAWAKALFNVFNNRYLGSYNTLNELSRYWNRDGFIYASSPYNRQKNIMNCLSWIYWYRVQEDFPIRRRTR